jgi:methionyl-tRNA formyltransferase
MERMRELENHWARPRKIAVVVDNDSWYLPFAQLLVAALQTDGDEAYFAASHAQIVPGDVAFYLSCTRLTPPEILSRNRLNLVVHASALPQGRGFSPLVWRILEGASEIVITMIEAVDKMDAGDIYDRRTIAFGGHELNAELRSRMAREINAMCLDFMRSKSPPGPPQVQEGEPSYYSRRRPADSRIDPNKTLTEQFDLLRVVDNDRYPAFFDYRGHRYILKIEDGGPTPEKS